MKKSLKIVLIIIGVLILCIIAGVIANYVKTDEEEITIVLSLEDEITDNSAWCGTFNLIWNDLKNDLAKQDIVFTPQLDTVKNLNKGTFTTAYLSEDSYYKVYGYPSIELRNQIEKAIKEKFNETSDILDNFDWNNHEEGDYFLYAMLKKEFEFSKEFTDLGEGTFGPFGKYKDVEYFGVNEDSGSQVRNQVRVLYYNSKNDFAIKLLTKESEEVIIARGTTQNTFGEIYQEIVDNSNDYDGTKYLNEYDTVKIPNISLNLEAELTELENQPFLFSNGEEYVIEKAMQTIQFELDKTGGSIKSEVGMLADELGVSLLEKQRNFVVDDTFVIFLKEEGKDLPYFGAKISDISTVQD